MPPERTKSTQYAVYRGGRHVYTVMDGKSSCLVYRREEERLQTDRMAAAEISRESRYRVRISCFVCDREFKKKNLERHIENLHIGQEYKCPNPTCDYKGTKSQSCMFKHRRTMCGNWCMEDSVKLKRAERIRRTQWVKEHRTSYPADEDKANNPHPCSNTTHASPRASNTTSETPTIFEPTRSQAPPFALIPDSPSNSWVETRQNMVATAEIKWFSPIPIYPSRWHSSILQPGYTERWVETDKNARMTSGLEYLNRSPHVSTYPSSSPIFSGSSLATLSSHSGLYSHDPHPNIFDGFHTTFDWNADSASSPEHQIYESTL